MGPASDSANLPALPASQVTLPLQQDYGIQLDAGGFFANDPALQGTHFEIWSKGESPSVLESGTFQANGRSNLFMTPSKQPVDILIGENEWFDVEEIQTSEGLV